MRIKPVLFRIKPILFNTEMVRAILAGRKTQTRRLVKNQFLTEDDLKICGKPYDPGDILWVRETWKQYTTGTAGAGLIDGYLYKADDPQDTSGMMVEGCWHPSIHMPREAARLFLRVLNVHAERLQEITYEDCIAEGIEETGIDWPELPKAGFKNLWESTLKKTDLQKCSWSANPWVWVIEFLRVYS